MHSHFDSLSSLLPLLSPLFAPAVCITFQSDGKQVDNLISNAFRDANKEPRGEQIAGRGEEGSACASEANTEIKERISSACLHRSERSPSSAPARIARFGQRRSQPRSDLKIRWRIHKSKVSRIYFDRRAERAGARRKECARHTQNARRAAT